MVFHFLIVSPFKHTANKPGEGLACLKVHALLPMVSFSQEDITFSLLTLLEIKSLRQNYV